MISQPPVIEIKNIYRFETFEEENFNINYNPYTFLVKMLDAKDTIKNEDYRYVLSRCGDDIKDNEIRQYIGRYNKELILDKLKTFNRNSDEAPEDFNKEIRKYMLGIVNLEKDQENNYFSFADIDGSKTSISGYKVGNREKYYFIKKMYKLVEKYKLEKYKELFENFEVCLKEKYKNNLDLKDYIYNWGYIIGEIASTDLSKVIIKLINKVDDVNRNDKAKEILEEKINKIRSSDIKEIYENLNIIIKKNIETRGNFETSSQLSKIIYLLLHAKNKYAKSIDKVKLEEDLKALNINHKGRNIDFYTEVLESLINDNKLDLEEVKKEILFNQDSLKLEDKELENIFEGLLTSTIETNLKKNENIESEWYEYIGQFDENIVINLIYIAICLKYKQYDFKLTVKNLSKGLKDFQSFNKYFGIDLKETIKKLQNYYKSNQESLYIINESISIVKKNSNKMSEDDIAKISLKFSRNIEVKGDEKRNRSNVIDYVRQFYISNYKDTDGLIKCDCCGKKTFLSKSNNESFLEFHHLIPFNDENANGPDHYLNLVGLCPNCHKKIHHIKEEELEQLHKDIDSNNNLGIKIFERVKKLISISRENKIKPDLVTPKGLLYLRSVKAINNDEFRELMKSI